MVRAGKARRIAASSGSTTVSFGNEAEHDRGGMHAETRRDLRGEILRLVLVDPLVDQLPAPGVLPKRAEEDADQKDVGREEDHGGPLGALAAVDVLGDEAGRERQGRREPPTLTVLGEWALLGSNQ